MGARYDQYKHDVMIANALGQLDGWTRFSKFGYNSAVGASEEDVWLAGGTKTLLSSAETMDIASSSANDTSAGTGARTVYIEGLDGDYLAASETVTLNGTSDVTTTNSYIRVHRMYVATAGSGNGAAGTITATASSSAVTQAQMTGEDNQTLQAIYTVPANKCLIFREYYASTPQNDSMELYFKIRTPGSNVWRTQLHFQVYETYFRHECANGVIFQPKTDLKISAKKLNGGGTGATSGVFTGYLIPQNDVKGG